MLTDPGTSRYSHCVIIVQELCIPHGGTSYDMGHGCNVLQGTVGQSDRGRTTLISFWPCHPADVSVCVSVCWWGAAGGKGDRRPLDWYPGRQVARPIIFCRLWCCMWDYLCCADGVLLETASRVTSTHFDVSSACYWLSTSINTNSSDPSFSSLEPSSARRACRW